MRDVYTLMKADLGDYIMLGGVNQNGESIVVEIDESKFGKRKYHRGHRVEGVWVFGMVEITSEKRLFLTTVPNRTASTLLPIIRAHVRLGSTIRSDAYSSYHYLGRPPPGEHGPVEYIHQVINHSEAYARTEVLPDGTTQRVHTNTIEGTALSTLVIH